VVLTVDLLEAKDVGLEALQLWSQDFDSRLKRDALRFRVVQALQVERRNSHVGQSISWGDGCTNPSRLHDSSYLSALLKPAEWSI
jgi:hypothetical protein